MWVCIWPGDLEQDEKGDIRLPNKPKQAVKSAEDILREAQDVWQGRGCKSPTIECSERNEVLWQIYSKYLEKRQALETFDVDLLGVIFPVGRAFSIGGGAAESAAASAARGLEIAPGKFDYLFGRVSSNAHNAARSNQLALEMKRLGVPDTAVGRRMLSEHLALSARAEGNLSRTFSNQYGNFEVRESLFMGPSGKAAKFESTFQVLDDGTRRLSTVIPFH